MTQERKQDIKLTADAKKKKSTDNGKEIKDKKSKDLPPTKV